MKTAEETRAAIRHLVSAHKGALNACAPQKPGVMEGDAAKREFLQDENRVRADIIGRMIDTLHWSLGEPSQLAEMIVQFERFDQIQRGKVA